MREYLFRGKMWDNSEWVYGNVIQSKEGDAFILPIEEGDVTDYYDVIPESVGQFTGRYDKSGNRIFEGSIMKGKFGTGFGGKSTKYKEFNFAIMYHEPTSSFCLEMPKGYGNYRFHPHWENCEIIGTKHDNPELLQSL